jgi:hypothetical protein
VSGGGQSEILHTRLPTDTTIGQGRRGEKKEKVGIKKEQAGIK